MSTKFKKYKIIGGNLCYDCDYNFNVNEIKNIILDAINYNSNNKIDNLTSSVLDNFIIWFNYEYNKKKHNHQDNIIISQTINNTKNYYFEFHVKIIGSGSYSNVFLVTIKKIYLQTHKLSNSSPGQEKYNNPITIPKYNNPVTISKYDYTFALKILHSNLSTESFKNELKFVTDVDKYNYTDLIKAFPFGNRAIIMEPCCGSLDSQKFLNLLTETDYSCAFEIVIKIIYSVINTLNKLIKRIYCLYLDLKPANILYKCENNKIKIYIGDYGGCFNSFSKIDYQGSDTTYLPKYSEKNETNEYASINHVLWNIGILYILLFAKFINVRYGYDKINIREFNDHMGTMNIQTKNYTTVNYIIQKTIFDIYYSININSINYKYIKLCDPGFIIKLFSKYSTEIEASKILNEFRSSFETVCQDNINNCNHNIECPSKN